MKGDRVKDPGDRVKDPGDLSEWETKVTQECIE